MALTKATSDVLSIADISKKLKTDATAGGIKEHLDQQLATKLDSSATASEATQWGGASKTVSLNAPSGGTDGDIWFQYE